MKPLLLVVFGLTPLLAAGPALRVQSAVHWVIHHTPGQ